VSPAPKPERADKASAVHRRAAEAVSARRRQLLLPRIHRADGDADSAELAGERAGATLMKFTITAAARFG
jgi:hypothetical protein